MIGAAGHGRDHEGINAAQWTNYLIISCRFLPRSWACGPPNRWIRGIPGSIAGDISTSTVAWTATRWPRPCAPWWPRPGRPSFDLPGVGLLAAALLLITVPLMEAPSHGWSVAIVVPLLLAIPAFALFVRREHRVLAAGRTPLVPPALFRRRGFSYGNIINLTFFAASTGLFFILTLHLQGGLHFSPLTAATTFAVLAIAFAVASLFAPRLQQRIGSHVLTVGYALNAAGSLILLLSALAAGTGLSPALLAPAFVVIGVGQGLGVTPLLGVILSGVPAADAGTAGGVLETVGQIGMSLGVVVLGLIYSSAVNTPVTANGSAHAFTAALVANVALAAVAMVVAVLLARKPGTPAS